MTRNIFLLISFSMIIFSACNNATKDSGNTSDSASAKTDESMDHAMPDNIQVPELPMLPEGAKVIFKNLKNGAIVTSPFKVEMGTEIIKVDTAGPVIAGIGHHHLFVNAEDSLPAGTIVPNDSLHIHFGKGQKEYELKLTPGKYKLTLQFADGLHRSYGGKMATSIQITVK